ncbi:hypothetical protein ACFFSW_35775 [Saccharothrix longispora]|uniref:Uncharacterized protein n=1 Tax=Saccharothrix longispora TaxID=33920 RepID=A0ABU1PV58_9PSEU|nr:hypothetical protein [Saccharothrix longispora]MDR6594024.1 hypothetical protein [Saccharothrix longispora]
MRDDHPDGTRGPADLDPVTAESELEPDFGDEHDSTTVAGDTAPAEGPDESVPEGHGGMDAGGDGPP